MKKIGIIIRENESDNITYLRMRKDLFDAFSSYDVAVVVIPIMMDFAKIKELVLMCDGIVLSGGMKGISNDYLLVDYLYKSNKPTLGICLGMQVIAMAYNGYKEAHVFGHQSKDEYVHSVSIDKESKLYSILQKERIIVNSRHNDCIPETTFVVSAKSEDGIIEAIEDATKHFFIGVQWHPESILDENSKALFQAFVNSL